MTLLEYLNNWGKNTKVRIAIIGAGIAGICMARALANLSKKNIYNHILSKKESEFHTLENITIFEKANSLDEALVSSASGNPIGIMHPIISRDEFARNWTDKGILTTIRWVKELKMNSEFYSLCGVLHLPRNNKQSDDWQNWRNYKSLGSDFIKKENLFKKFKYIKSETNAIWTSHCGWINPKEFIKVALKETEKNLGEKLKIIFNSYIKLEQLKNLYSKQTKHSPIAFDTVIIASGSGSYNLLNQPSASCQFGMKKISNEKTFLDLVNGQITGIPLKKNLAKYFSHNSVLCKSGFITPIVNGCIFSGATYETVEKPHNIPTTKNRIENIIRLTNLIPHTSTLVNLTNHQKIFDRVSTRCVSKDRLPIIGLIDKETPKIYAFTAFGSRGLSWGPSAAESLAKVVLAKNLVKDETLIDKKISPSRFKIKN